MPPENFFLIFIAFFAAETFWELYLVRKNISWIKNRADRVPEYLKNRVTLKELQKASRYSRTKGSLTIVETLFSASFLLIVVSTGIIGGIDSYLSFITPTWFRVAVFFALLLVLQHLINIPLNIYAAFVIEKRFGFNKMTPATFLLDQVKGISLSLLIMIPLLECMVWFISHFTAWWLYSWLTLSLFSILMMWIYPAFIAPLFNKFSPLPDGELKDALEDLALKTGFSFKDLKIMDASKRSKHSNAYFTGFGKVKRVVLFDTLIASMNTNELVSILAHELGHFKMRHVLKGLVISQAFLLCGFIVMGLYKDLPWIYTGLGMNQNNWSVLLAFGLIIPRITYWLSPLSGLYSRHNEFQADSYAKSITGTGRHLQSALISLEKENLSSPEPHPLFQKWHYSHPTVGQRVEALESTHAQQ